MRVLVLVLVGVGCASAPKTKAQDPVTGKALAQQLIIVDGHVDVPYRQRDATEEIDFSKRTDDGHFDYVRAKEGGLDAPFMSIYVPADLQAKKGDAKKLADELIDMVEGFTTKWPDKFAIARTPDEVRTHVNAGKIALPLGIENGAALEDDVANVQHFYDRGVRYITLTHSKDNLICDSSYDQSRTHGGLSEFGKDVVKEMNRLGIMVDVSHLSDATIEQVLELSSAPVIASHSSARKFTPGFERNLSDDLIEKIAAKDGVVMINYGSSFITAEANAYGMKAWDAIRAFMKEHDLKRGDPKVQAFVDDYKKENPLPRPKLSDVVDHFMHVIDLVGVDHVGMGSDFDGVGSLPEGLEDASKVPDLIQALLDRGVSPDDMKKIASDNVFRVWERAATTPAAPSPP